MTHRAIQTPARLMLLAAAFSLGACASTPRLESPFNSANDGLTAAERHPIALEQKMISQNVIVGPQALTLSDASRADVMALLTDYRARGSGRLSIASPASSPNTSAATSIVAEITSLAQSIGIAPNRLDIAAYRSAGDDERAPIMVSYMVASATPSACGQWDTNLGWTPLNRTSPNFGCATQNNLAVLVENPGDLASPRALGPADPARRATTLEKYRKGEVTAAEKEQDGAATISEVSK